MVVSGSCSWCHHSNPGSERWCANCGHEAHAPRMECRCPRCSPDGPDPTEADIREALDYGRTADQHLRGGADLF